MRGPRQSGEQPRAASDARARREATLNEIDDPFALGESAVEEFHERGFIRLRNVFSPATLHWYGERITRAVLERNAQRKALAERTTYEKAFLQITNLWRTDDAAKSFVHGRRLASIAARLLRVAHVRLYHDQALYKEPGGGITPWHADQYYWPLNSRNTCTVWVPFQPTPLEMGPMAFAIGSHRLDIGRDLPIGDASERALAKELASRNYRDEMQPFDLGEVSFHWGWTLHHAGANTTGASRAAMTVIYMEDGIRLGTLERPEHFADRDAFMPGLQPGDPVTTPLNPVLF